MDVPEDELMDRRKSVRFSSANQEFVFEKDRTMTSTAGESTGPVISDENVPIGLRNLRPGHFVSPSTQYKQDPLSASGHDNIKLSISPGTNATASKRDAKLRKLQELQQQREAMKVSKSALPTVPQPIDLAGTERSFLESSSMECAKLPNSQFGYSVPEPKFSDISSIQPSDATASSKTPKKLKNVVCSTPLRYVSPAMGVPASIMKSDENDVFCTRTRFQPAATVSSMVKEMVLACDEDYFMSRDERADRHMEAMSVWCNMILRSQYEDDEFDMGATKQEASKVLQDLLLKSTRSSSAVADKPFKYSDFLKRQKRDNIREKAIRLFNSTNVPERIRQAVNCRLFSVRAGCNVYSDLSLQTTLLRLFLSFHPAWLHLGLETVFNTTINVRDDEVFIQVIIRFIMQRLFADPKILKNRKYAYGSGKLVLTERGREALNCHFLAHTALFCYFVETAKAASIIKPNPRMFTRNSAFKCLDDVFAELSREVLSGGGASLNRAFAKMGFKPTYKQGFIDDYCYSVKSFADLTNGVIIGKIVELVTGCNPGSIMGRLRNPCGDRLRKIGNVKTCLQVAAEKGVDVGGIKAESVVAGSKDTLLELLWKLVGVYVSVDDERKLRRASLALTHTNGGLGVKYGAVSADAKGEQLVLHVCKQIGLHLGIEVDQLDDLRDGRVLSGAWRIFNVHAPDIRLYPGESLFLKVANAAASDLDIPWGLHNSIGLFTVFYLSGLFSIREVHDAAVRIQRSYRSYRFFKTLKILLQDARSGAGTSGVYDRSSLLKTYVVSPIGGGGAQISKSNTVKGEEARRALGEVQEKIELDKSMTSHEKEQHGRNIILSDSAVKIQRAFRRHQLRARLRVERQQRWAKYTWAATVIQRAFRRHQLRTRLRVERQQRWAEYTRAATVIQRAFRRHQLRTRLRVERQQRWAEYTRAATVIQRAFRRHQLRTRLRVERQQRWAEYTRAAAVIQSRTSVVPNDDLERIPSTSTGHEEGEQCVDIERVLQLQRNIRENERLQKMCSNILQACERKLSEEEPDRNDEANVTTGHGEQAICASYVPSLADQTRAAVKIQAWFRGCRERIALRKHLEERRQFMNAYRGNVAAEEPSDVVDNIALSSRPVHEKIHAAVDMLFDPKMYVSKVGAFILNRLSALSPHLCAYLVIDAQGLAAILDIFEQKTTGRGPATAEILVILQEVFLRIVECSHPAVIAEVDANIADCVKVSLHIFHAFYINPVIVEGFGRAILALHRRQNAKPHFEKANFYLNYASKRFARLPGTDPRKIVLSEMRSEMLSK